MTAEVTHLWACGKTILELDTEEINKLKYSNSQQNLAIFLAATGSENKII